MELTNKFSDTRFFNSWSMGFCYTPKTDMQALIHAEWQNQLPTVGKYANASFGLKMLQEFWTRLAV